MSDFIKDFEDKIAHLEIEYEAIDYEINKLNNELQVKVLKQEFIKMQMIKLKNAISYANAKKLGAVSR